MRTKQFMLVFMIALLCGMVNGCAFIPRNVDINEVKGRIAYPRQVFPTSHTLKFGPFVDSRDDKEKLGVGRNKLMMVTTSVSMSGDLSKLFEEMVRQNFAAHGIGDGESALQLKGEILDAYTDLPGPNDVYVEITASLTLIDSNNKRVFYKTLRGYQEVPVAQISNLAHVNAFAGAMNQINDQVQEIAFQVAEGLEQGENVRPTFGKAMIPEQIAKAQRLTREKSAAAVAKVPTLGEFAAPQIPLPPALGKGIGEKWAVVIGISRY